MITSMKKVIVLSIKTYEYASGIAEDMLYNITIIASFVNISFET